MNCITNDRSYLRNINNNDNDDKQTHLPPREMGQIKCRISKKIPPFLLYPIKHNAYTIIYSILQQYFMEIRFPTIKSTINACCYI